VRQAMLAVLVLAAACGGDSSGPSRADFSGTYNGQFYVIATSANPAGRDSLNGGAVTLTLAHTSGDSYHLSETTSGGGGSSADLTIDQAGAMSFPSYDQSQALALIGSLLTGICNLSSAVATPSGSVVNGRLTVSSITSGSICDWSGNGTDIRATIIQLTWTGSR
jgi:hypothetical protein